MAFEMTHKWFHLLFIFVHSKGPFSHCIMITPITGVFGKRIYHAKNVPSLLSATIYATYLKPYLSPHNWKQYLIGTK